MNNQLTWQTFLFLIFLIASSNSYSAESTEPANNPALSQSGTNPQCPDSSSAALIKKMAELQELQAEMLLLQRQLNRRELQRKPVIFLPPAY